MAGVWLNFLKAVFELNVERSGYFLSDFMSRKGTAKGRKEAFVDRGGEKFDISRAPEGYKGSEVSQFMV